MTKGICRLYTANSLWIDFSVAFFDGGYYLLWFVSVYQPSLCAKVLGLCLTVNWTHPDSLNPQRNWYTVTYKHTKLRHFLHSPMEDGLNYTRANKFYENELSFTFHFIVHMCSYRCRIFVPQWEIRMKDSKMKFQWNHVWRIFFCGSSWLNDGTTK